VNDAIPLSGGRYVELNGPDQEDRASRSMESMTLSEKKPDKEGTKEKDTTEQKPDKEGTKEKDTKDGDIEDRDRDKSQKEISEMQPRREENAGRFFDYDEGEQVR
jgi:hypothetical protein